MTHDSDHHSPSSRLDDHTRDLLRKLGSTTSRQLRHELCDDLIVRTVPVADRVAARFRNRGIPTDDLQQVARTALVKAARKFEGADERAFLGYLIPSIRGEVKRYFRDSGWMIRPPRSLQEARQAVSMAKGELRAALGQEPSSEELAHETDLDLEVVKSVHGLDSCYQPDSMDRPIGDDEASTSVGETCGELDPGFDQAEARALIEPLLRQLKPRDRQLIHLRFFEGLTQAETGRCIGVSQMQVSRIETKILADFRESLHGNLDTAA